MKLVDDIKAKFKENPAFTAAATVLTASAVYTILAYGRNQATQGQIDRKRFKASINDSKYYRKQQEQDREYYRKQQEQYRLLPLEP